MTDVGSKQALPNLMSTDVAGIGKKQFEALAAVQKEFLGALGKSQSSVGRLLQRRGRADLQLHQEGNDGRFHCRDYRSSRPRLRAMARFIYPQ